MAGAVNQAPYTDLGGFPVTAVADTSGAQPFGKGFASMLLDADTTFHLSVTLAEIYHMFVSAPPGTAFQVWKNSLAWDYVLVGANAWDPAVPMPIRSGDKLTFWFDQPATANITGTIWLREPLGFTS